MFIGFLLIVVIKLCDGRIFNVMWKYLYYIKEKEK